MEHLTNTYYTLIDINRQRSPSLYVLTVIALAKQAEAKYPLVLYV
jgi:hypothetical protein